MIRLLILSAILWTGNRYTYLFGTDGRAHDKGAPVCVGGPRLGDCHRHRAGVNHASHAISLRIVGVLEAGRALPHPSDA